MKKYTKVKSSSSKVDIYQDRISMLDKQIQKEKEELEKLKKSIQEQNKVTAKNEEKQKIEQKPKQFEQTKETISQVKKEHLPKQNNETISQEKKPQVKRNIKRQTSHYKKPSFVTLLFQKILLVIVLIVIVFVIAYISKYISYIANTATISTDVNDFVGVSNDGTILQIDFNSIKNINEDVVAYLIINGTNVSYPVVQCDDNSYYDSHSLDKSDNSLGWVYADSSCNLDATCDNIVIYGKNTVSGQLFSGLDEVLTLQWQENSSYRKIFLATPDGLLEYYIFSIYESEENQSVIDYETSPEKYINTALENSVYNFETDVNSDDNLLTLIAYNNNNNKKVILYAKQK